jgi:hypothetical protein
MGDSQDFERGDCVKYRVTGEYGEVTSTGVVYVFVHYDGDVGSKATLPEDLEKI